MNRITTGFIQQELEVIGRLETAVKAEVGALRDEFRQFTVVVLAQLADANRRAERMADRIIELAMVNRGDGQSAVAHRRMAGSDSIPSSLNSNPNSTDLWGNAPVEEEDTWPPKGFDIIPSP
jgi:hypothetical protein